MVRHLIKLGHRRVAIVKGAAGNYDASERLRGYRLALREAGIRSDRALERNGRFTEGGGYEAAVELLQLKARPTAIFAANDSMAIGVLSALKDASLRVPADIAVGGFDDIPLARYMDPPLSSVRVPISSLGRRAIEMLVIGVTERNGHIRNQERVATELVIRKSCGASSSRPPPRGRGRIKMSRN